MRGRQKGQTKRMSIIKDPVIAPYEIQVEEDQYVLIDTEKEKPLGYYTDLVSAIQKVSRISLANTKEEYTFGIWLPTNKLLSVPSIIALLNRLNVFSSLPNVS